MTLRGLRDILIKTNKALVPPLQPSLFWALYYSAMFVLITRPFVGGEPSTGRSLERSRVRKLGVLAQHTTTTPTATISVHRFICRFHEQDLFTHSLE